MVYDRSSSQNLYKSLCVNKVKSIRDESATKSTSPSKQKTPNPVARVGNNVVSHESILTGSISGTFSIGKRQKSIQTNELSDAELYKMLSKYVMTESQLIEYGYPREDPNNRGNAILPKPDANKLRNNYESRLRTCCRCKKVYTVNDNEMPIKKEACVFHPGRLWNERFNKSIEKKYSCCKNDPGSGGCSSSNHHVIDGFDHPDYCKNYLVTLPKRPPPVGGYYGIYGLDCEMVRII